MHNIKICSFLLLLNWTAIAAADDFTTQLIKNAQSLHFRYSQRGDEEVTYWKVSFSGEEIRSIEPLLKKLQPYDPERFAFMSSFSATLKASDKEYRLIFGDEKNPDRPIAFAFRHDGVEKKYRLTGDDAKMFRTVFDNAMKSKVQVVEPYRIVKLTKPGD